MTSASSTTASASAASYAQRAYFSASSGTT
jgi:hypothetical protein